jgi:hypothetical protein
MLGVGGTFDCWSSSGMMNGMKWCLQRLTERDAMCFDRGHQRQWQFTWSRLDTSLFSGYCIRQMDLLYSELDSGNFRTFYIFCKLAIQKVKCIRYNVREYIIRTSLLENHIQESDRIRLRMQCEIGLRVQYSNKHTRIQGIRLLQSDGITEIIIISPTVCTTFFSGVLIREWVCVYLQWYSAKPGKERRQWRFPKWLLRKSRLPWNRNLYRWLLIKDRNLTGIKQRGWRQWRNSLVVECL